MSTPMIDARLVGQRVTVRYDHAYRERFDRLGITPPIPPEFPEGFSATIFGVETAAVVLMIGDGRMFRWNGECVVKEIRFDDPAAAAWAVSESNQQMLATLLGRATSTTH